MLEHDDIWRAIDRLASERGLSASGLARRAGLDPTTFNRSKRVTRDGKPRWPSTESIAKILAATGSKMADFVAFLGEGGGDGLSRNLPVMDIGQAASGSHLDSGGVPFGGGWDEILFPDLADATAFALEIDGDAFSPFYRAGDVIVISPAANLRRGDRVVIRTRDGGLLLATLRRRSARRIEIADFRERAGERTLAADDVAWMARIVWASQ